MTQQEFMQLSEEEKEKKRKSMVRHWYYIREKEYIDNVLFTIEEQKRDGEVCNDNIMKQKEQENKKFLVQKDRIWY